MKTSVVIIAHNEEKHIEKCILSVLDQSKLASEIILIAHNCTDNTTNIATQYPLLKTVVFNEGNGIIDARLEGLSHTTKDIILCIDGDCIADKNWIEEMTETLSQNNNILVGSWVKFKGTFFGFLSNIFNKNNCQTKGGKATRWIWGASFAFWRKDIEFVKKVFKESTSLSSQLNLTRNPEDFWLALLMSQRGNIEVTNKTHVSVKEKERSTLESIKRNIENKQNGHKIERSLNK